MGPTLMVHLPGALTSAGVNAIVEILARTVVAVSRTHGTSWEFLPSADPDACTSTLQVVPFGTEAAGPGKHTADNPELRAEAQKRLPFLPHTTLQLDNFCRSDLEGHRVLAGLAVCLAEHFGGLIFVDCAHGMIDAVGYCNGERRTDIYTLEYVIDASSIERVYCVGPKLMADWMVHPQFWLLI